MGENVVSSSYTYIRVINKQGYSFLQLKLQVNEIGLIMSYLEEKKNCQIRKKKYIIWLVIDAYTHFVLEETALNNGLAKVASPLTRSFANPCILLDYTQTVIYT